MEAEAGGVHVDSLRSGDDDSGRRAREHNHPPGVVLAVHPFQRHSDREVVSAVAVEVGGSEGVSELVAGGDDVGNPRGVLVEELPEGLERVHSIRVAVADLDRAAAVETVDVLAGNADGEVVEAVAVEVPGNQRMAEVVALLGLVDGRGAALPEVFRERGQLERDVALAEEDLHLPDVGEGRERTVVAAQADGQVVDAVAIEVADRDRGSELIADARRMQRIGRGLVDQLRARRRQTLGEQRAARQSAGQRERSAERDSEKRGTGAAASKGRFENGRIIGLPPAALRRAAQRLFALLRAGGRFGGQDELGKPRADPGGKGRP